MPDRNPFVQGVAIALAIVLVLSVTVFLSRRSSTIHGAVISASAVPAREFPLADVEVTVAGEPAAPIVHSDASGFFAVPIPLRQLVRGGAPLSLVFRHPGYQPLELHGVALDKLCIARMAPLAPAASEGPPVFIGNVIARYSMLNTTMINVGSAQKTFEVVNTGNVACDSPHPCSPDGHWAAAAATATLDAGHGNQFRNARASCVAGPCPFTKVLQINSSGGSQTLRVSVLDWSDTATFLLEAEVYRAVVSDAMRNSYPVIFGDGLTFTLPPAAEGVSIEAEFDGKLIVFPLGPTPMLSWADCNIVVNPDQSRVYRCKLKPGYKFVQSSSR